MTFEEARSKATGNVKNCVEMWYSLKDQNYYSVNLYCSISGQWFYRWREHDMTGTSYGKSHPVSVREAALIHILDIADNWDVEKFEENFLKETYDNIEKYLEEPGII